MDKKAITAEIINQLGLALPVEQALKLWWWPDGKYNGRANPRLSLQGKRVFSKAKQPHQFPYEVRPTGNVYKRLMKLQTPFYIDFKEGHITFFSTQVASAVVMYGSFDRFMELLDD